MNNLLAPLRNERHYIKDVPERTLEAMKLLETLCNERATQEEAKPN